MRERDRLNLLKPAGYKHSPFGAEDYTIGEGLVDALEDMCCAICGPLPPWLTDGDRAALKDAAWERYRDLMDLATWP